MAVHHVATHGSDSAAGTVRDPFRTVNHAAQLAVAGDTVLVRAGEYREWVRPARGGLSDSRRITYAAADGEHVVLKGSERITSWLRHEGDVWMVVLPNHFFGDWNPYALQVEGDWLVRPVAPQRSRHLGDVYLNGRSFYEVDSRAEVAEPVRHETVVDDRTGRTVEISAPAQTLFVWYAEVDATSTTIWANFGGANPNAELTEINVRRSVFYPVANHVDYLTVRGFELAHAATPWAPPTADQPGLIGPNWAKSWIIEDNDIHDAKCAAVSIGKDAATGDNFFTRRRDKPGYQYQLEAVFTARHLGWSKERIGSHRIRNNRIHDCGQNAVVGHLGGVFSTIEGNDIHDIGTKREFYGHEIGGIKLHAALDVLIKGNHIHNTALGVWLDWQTQGTRISQNVFHHNSRDLYIEASHGPYVVDNNILASAAAIENMSDGGAYVTNLIAGTILIRAVMDRPTPYHVPHSTEIAGYAATYGGDDRFIGNIFVGNGREATGIFDAYAEGSSSFDSHTRAGYGTFVYNGHPVSLTEYLAQVREFPAAEDSDIFPRLKNPVHIRDNVYLEGAVAYEREVGALVDARAAAVSIEVLDSRVALRITLPEAFDDQRIGLVRGLDLARVRMVDADFENPDGSPVRLAEDLIGDRRPNPGPVGPLVPLRSGPNRVDVWPTGVPRALLQDDPAVHHREKEQ